MTLKFMSLSLISTKSTAKDKSKIQNNHCKKINPSKIVIDVIMTIQYSTTFMHAPIPFQ